VTDPQQYQTQYQSGLGEAQHDLRRFFQEDGTNYFVQQIWNDEPNIDGGVNGDDVNGLLNNGAPGLEWFKRALIRYHRVWDTMRLPGFDRIDVPPITVDGESLGSETIDTAADPEGEITRLEGKWYDQQRHLELASLRDLAAKISDASGGNGEQPSTDVLANDLTGVANAVPEAWQGPAGDAAQDFLAGFHAHAQQQNQYLQAMSAALQGLPDALLQIVKDKASFVAGFGTSQCPVAGHAMKLSSTDNDPVSVIITVAGDKIAAKHDFSDVETQFNIPYQSEGEDSQLCKDWLINHFRPAVREAFIAFVHQCALADHYIRRAYQPVMDLLDNHDPRPFPQPEQPTPEQPTAEQPTSEGPAVAAPVTAADAGAAAPASAAPAIPSGAAPAPSDLSPSLGGLAQQTVAQGLEQVQSFAQQGISQVQSLVQQGLGGLSGNPATPGTDPAAPALTSASAPTAGKPLADFTVAGEHVSVTRGPDGSMTGTVSGPDGTTQRYTMGLRNGIPYLTPGGGSPPPPASSTPAGTAKPGGSTSLGGGFGASAGGPGASSASPAPGGSAPVPESLVPQQQSTTAPAEATTAPTSAQPNAATAAPPMGMGGMPMGAAAGGKGEGDRERRASGIVAPKPMWRDSAPDNGFLTAPPAVDDENTYRELREGSARLDPPAAAEPSAPAPVAVAPQAASEPPQAPVPAPAPARRTDGVKIEIDMGDAK
jgi:hypothetical protein